MILGTFTRSDGMNSMSACGKTDLPIPMISSRPRSSAELQRRRLWKVEGAAYALAILAHLGLWQLYKAMPIPPPPKEEPLIIEAALAVSKSAPASAATASAPPQPQIQQPPKPLPPKPQVQPPKPKPVPRVEKPASKKPEEAKPRPKPVSKPRQEAAREQEAEPPAPPAAQEEAPPAPPAPPAQVHKAPPKPPQGDDEDNNRYITGTVGGYRMNYPSLARQRGWEGTVTVKIHVSADGEIEDANVVGSSGHEMLDDSALDMVRSASHVKPCRRSDKPVGCTFTQAIHFKLSRE